MIVGIRGDETFTKIGDQLRRGNSYAGALILVRTDEGPDEKTVLYAAVDAGAGCRSRRSRSPKPGFGRSGRRQWSKVTGVQRMLLLGSRGGV